MLFYYVLVGVTVVTVLRTKDAIKSEEMFIQQVVRPLFDDWITSLTDVCPHVPP